MVLQLLNTINDAKVVPVFVVSGEPWKAGLNKVYYPNWRFARKRPLGKPEAKGKLRQISNLLSPRRQIRSSQPGRCKKIHSGIDFLPGSHLLNTSLCLGSGYRGWHSGYRPLALIREQSAHSRNPSDRSRSVRSRIGPGPSTRRTSSASRTSSLFL